MKPRFFLITLIAAVFVAMEAHTLSAHVPPPAAQFATPVLQRDDQGTVTLTCATPGAVIRYSIDGSDPGPKGGPYLAPVALAHGGVVKARAFSVDRKLKSELAEAKFEPLPGVARPPTTLVPCTQDRDWPTYDWAKRHAAVTALTRERRAELVFVGDSITQMFGGQPHDRGQPGKNVWEKFYDPRNTANLGFGYDYVENTLWRLQHGELDGAKAKVVVVHIGTNNTGKNSAEEIAASIRAICEEIQKRQPSAKILLLAILPRSPKPDASRAKLGEVNKLIAKFDGQNGITFLDAGAKFVAEDGSISRELMGDFLHPTEKGYTLWAEAMEPVLRRLLGESKP